MDEQVVAKLAASTPAAIIVDDFLDNPDEIRRFALRQQFQENKEYHKGERTKERFLWPGVKERFEQLLGKRINLWEHHGFNGVFQWCKAGDQIVFHSDQQRYAGVIYLTPEAPPEAGTTLYRSKECKGRTVEESMKLMAYCPASASGTVQLDWQQVEMQMYKGKLLDPTAWEVVDVFGNVYNRLVIWNAHLVHAASCYFGETKENARLFQMFFFDTET